MESTSLILSCISIRAPARGATHRLSLTAAWCQISIRAPARGATIQYSPDDSSLSISIRAPARGATITADGLAGKTTNFNPRSREGSDKSFDNLLPIPIIFQSALPRGERQAETSSGIHVSLGFQSALPRGERHDRLTDRRRGYVFQSALPRGERRYRLVKSRRGRYYFNPRSREGSD